MQELQFPSIQFHFCHIYLPLRLSYWKTHQVAGKAKQRCADFSVWSTGLPPSQGWTRTDSILCRLRLSQTISFFSSKSCHNLCFLRAHQAALGFLGLITINLLWTLIPQSMERRQLFKGSFSTFIFPWASDNASKTRSILF